MNSLEIAPCHPQTLTEFQGNAFIEVFPPLPEDDKLLLEFARLLRVSDHDRRRPTSERMALLLLLEGTLVPLPQHLEVAHAIWAMRNVGYVGRGPNSVARGKAFEELHHCSQSRTPAWAGSPSRARPVQMSMLIGVPGSGKTLFTKTYLERTPQVVWHPALQQYQVTYLILEAPSTGKGLSSLFRDFIEEFDRLIPGVDHGRVYVKGGPRAPEQDLAAAVVRLLLTYNVGLVVLDELQHLSLLYAQPEAVMSRLVALCNRIRVPVLFIGTPKSRDVLTAGLRGSRRAVNTPVTPWDRLPEFPADGQDDLFGDVLYTLFKRQIVRNPVELDAALRRVFYKCTQGILSLIVALFAATQKRAMYDGSERITVELVERVYKELFAPVHAAMEALEKGAVDVDAELDDVSLCKLPEILAAVRGRGKAARTGERGRSKLDLGLAPGSDVLGPAAADIAAASEHAVRNAPSSAEKSRARPSRRRDAPPASFADDDYRSALAHAHATGRAVSDVLIERGLAPSIDEVLKFS
jgi:hypothetical protein